jgi:membrane protease subunit HflC
MNFNRSQLTALGIAIIVVGIVAFSSLFTVDQRQQALVLQLGEPKRVINEPGLWTKLPFIQNVVYYDKRVLDLDPTVEQVILADQIRLDVDSFARYRIVDPLRFFQAVTSEAEFRQRLSNVVNSSLRRVLGSVSLLTVLSQDRDNIMADIKKDVDSEMRNFGVQIVDVRIRRADLPEQATQATYARMRSEREREARARRAQGYEKAQQIRASADRERTVILAEARKDSEIIRGEGDNVAFKIYAEAAGKDPEFYRFYRSMEAYRKGLANDDTTMVLTPDSEFFRYFRDIKGVNPSPPAPRR